jgi:acyl-CoA thioesterase FadM
MSLAVTRIGTTSFTLAVTAQGGGSVRVTATQVLCLLSLDTGAVIPIPPDLKQRFERYTESAAAPAAPEHRARVRGGGGARARK